MKALKLEENFYDNIGVFNSLNSSIFANENYILFAINKLQKSNEMIQLAIQNIEEITVDQAKIEIAFIKTLKKDLKATKKTVALFPESEVKKIAIDFLKNVKKLQYQLKEIVIDDNIGRTMECDFGKTEYLNFEQSNQSFINLKLRVNAMS